ncbi:MAG: IS200/IS605 family transposase [Candidatus Taylorbacteria bacterium]|nr:IS200/IS605 family transposase [Candidatus Taylorbacteria bacterium]
MRTRSLNHSIYQLQYHMVWGTRYRIHFLKPQAVEKEFFESCWEVVKKYPTLYIHTMKTNVDHVHLHIEIPPNLSIAAVVQALKINTSIRLKKRFKFIKEAYLDGSNGVSDILSHHSASMKRPYADTFNIKAGRIRERQ